MSLYSLCVALFFALVPQAWAQPAQPLMLDTLAVTSVVPPPPWVREGMIEAQSEIVREQGRAPNGQDFFRWFSVPAGESFSDWSQHYMVRAERPLSGNLRLYANGEINRSLRDCDEGAVQFADTMPGNTLLFVVFCSESRTRPGTGRVAFFNLTQADDVLVQKVLQVRVRNFSLADGITPQTEARLRDGLRFIAQLDVVY
ncbi:MAG: hypothetical protein AAF700_01330 [Pseudomonadota bacterium]